MRPATLLTTLSSALLCPMLAAQQTNGAGLGTVKRWFNATAATNPEDVTISGIAYVNGKTYVASDGGSTNGTPMIYEFTNGKKTAQFPTPGSPLFGTTDLDTDGTVIFASSGSGIIVFDTSGKLASAVNAKNGSQTLAKNPIPANGNAIAYDPGGNSGNGSLLLGQANPSAAITEHDLSGNLLKSYPNKGWAATALTRDPRTGNLWCMSDPSNSDIIELDATNNFTPTGVRFSQGNEWPAYRGGLCGIPGGDPHSYASDFDIAVLTRLPGPDYVYIHRIHLYPGLLGQHEAQILGGVNTTQLGRGNLGELGPIKTGDTLSFQLLAAKGGRNGSPAIVTLAAGPDASRDGFHAFLPEWRIMTPFSVPPSPAVLFLPGLVGGPVANAKIPAGILRCFELIRLQALVIEVVPPPLKIVATNEIWTHAFQEKDCRILVEAVGADSDNNDTTKGFWRVIHAGGPLIREVKLDWSTTRDPAQASMRFDTDDDNAGYRFNAGNATFTTCRGTYRNGSDVKTGLVYDAMNTPPDPCATGANTGWIGANYINGVNDWQTLTFRFVKFIGNPTTPTVFEFDCDTDGGKGVDGGSMAGCVVTITLLGGQVLMGELRADPTNPQRSVAGF